MVSMKHTYWKCYIALPVCTLLLTGCATVTMFSYMEKGFQSDHGNPEPAGVYNTNDSCTVHGTCEGVSSCDLYGNC